VLIYQGYRIASLSSAGSSTSRIPQLVAQDSSLRATALWYPTVPSSDLCLNDESFTGESPLTAGYRPLVWIHFGGPNGTYLQSLTEISAILSVNSIHSIHFSYENGEVSKEMGQLGHRSIRAESQFGWLSDRSLYRWSRGELIDSFDVRIKCKEGINEPSFYRHGRLTSLKVSNLT
jgi:hypothetical protein